MTHYSFTRCRCGELCGITDPRVRPAEGGSWFILVLLKTAWWHPGQLYVCTAWHSEASQSSQGTDQQNW